MNPDEPTDKPAKRRPGGCQGGEAKPGEFRGVRPEIPPYADPDSSYHQTLLRRYRVFAEEWCRHGNRRVAAKAAGYVGSMAYRLMDKPEVQEFIAEFQAKQDEESEISTREVRDSYRAALRTTMRDIFEPWGAGDRLRLRAADDITPEAHLAIEEMSIDRWGKIKVKLSSKAKAREDAARMQGLFKQDNEQGADALAKALKALDEHTGLLPTDEDRKAWGEGEE